jgi:hypothetical protein
MLRRRYNRPAGFFPFRRNSETLSATRLRYDLTPRVWLAFGGTYDSGLPIDFGGTEAEASAEGYTQNILNRVNFSDLRPRPLWSLNASAGILLSNTKSILCASK